MRRSWPVRLLSGCLLFQGLGGLAGGLVLLVDPSGEAMGLSMSLLAGSSFPDYLVPGLVLFLVLGVAPVAAAWMVWVGRPGSWVAALAVGVALSIWIAVQILTIGYQTRPPLQVVYGTLAVIIVVLSLTHSVRTGLALVLFSLFLGAPTVVQAQAAAQIPECAADGGVDTDRDGLGDACESALARAFAPLLVARSGGCNWDNGAVPPRLGGGYAFVVQPLDDGVVVGFLPAFFRDCGWEGPKCRLPGVDCAGHAADSEFIAVLLGGDPGQRVVPERVFLSAHCFGRSGGECRWHESEALTWEGTNPVVWVAEGRQANYPGRSACDRGHYHLDTCDHHDTRFRFPIAGGGGNIGSAAHPRCTQGSELATPLVQPGVRECFWDPEQPFRGWQEDTTGVTGYGRYLDEIVGLGAGRETGGGADGAVSDGREPWVGPGVSTQCLRDPASFRRASQ